ncbi:MAG: Stk1 family PASTA domain-containing Ser/Thr kinase [Clostridia bacterium]|nr:Stk1 family PASTA domain-containing Ser/Thr kinase [Clostridia bacterium]
MDKYVGKRLDGRYVLREIIGVGGMAYVYKAYDEIDDRIVAVKILKEEYLNNEEFSRRFKNESKAIAILSHPNVVRVIDVSFTTGLQYIVMEYIDGITLKEYIEQQKALQWKEVVHFIVQILHALQHAHDKGIVHQDVKPQNIMLLANGTIKVTDFGIARFSRSSTPSSEQGDKAIGSVHYISPEQARAEITDEKSDIYSVGVMMYEMLTGKLPFESDNAVSVAIMQMQSTAERPTKINPDIPEGLEEITLKAMQKDPLARYQSAAEMLYDIDEFKNNPSIRFEYQYMSGNDETHYEEAFRNIRGTDRERPVRNKRAKQAKNDNDEAARPIPLIPILAGVAGALVLVVLIVGVLSLLGQIGGSAGGVENIFVPNLLNKNYELDVVNNEELQRNFVIKTSERISSEYPENTVLEQYPAPGREVKKGSQLNLTISRGEAQVDVPTIKQGEERDVAVNRIKQAGFVAKEVMASHDTVEAGKVISISPNGGEKLPKGSTVTVYISSGKEPVENITVPNVIGHAQADAIKRLTEKGFKVNESAIQRVNHPTYGEGVVVAQTPEGDTESAPDSEIILTVSSGYRDAEVVVDLPTQSGVTVDMKVELDGVEKYSKAGIMLPTESQSFSFSEQREEYTVKVSLAESGTGNYKPYATFKVSGRTGKPVSTEYSQFTVVTTTTPAPTTTTVATTEPTTETTAPTDLAEPQE